MALDKTGTLTTGELRLERVESFPPGREAEVTRLAFSLERLSTHPLARFINHVLVGSWGMQPLEFEHFEIHRQVYRACRAGDGVKSACWADVNGWRRATE